MTRFLFKHTPDEHITWNWRTSQLFEKESSLPRGHFFTSDVFVRGSLIFHVHLGELLGCHNCRRFVVTSGYNCQHVEDTTCLAPLNEKLAPPRHPSVQRLRF